MAALGPQAIDWNAPWYGAWKEAGTCAAKQCSGGLPVHAALHHCSKGEGIRFVDAGDLPKGVAYESHVFESRTCPTRDNLHDFFNGLAWIVFPRAKSRLNEIQAAEIRSGAVKVRGRVRDAITVFDENGALLHAPAPLWEALASREWRRLFVDLRPMWRDAVVVVFGHALLEKLAAPRKDLTAHVWRADAPADVEDMDGWLQARLDEPALAAKPFIPLPVLGIPGWWAGNEDVSFYDDPMVFRAARAERRP